jgi:hypothetical protein
MNRNLQIVIALTGLAAVIAGAYHERLGLPAWFENFAMLGVMPIALVLIFLLSRHAHSDSRAADSVGKLQRLWDHKPNRLWFAVIIMGVVTVVSLLLPPSPHISLHSNLVISLFAFVFGVAVVFVAVRWRRH